MADFRPKALLAHLTTYGVEFVVVGGIAATLQGSSRDTFDLDIWPSQEPANLDALGRALIDIEARLRGVDDDVPFTPDGRTLRGVQLLTLDTSLGPLDVLMRPDGSPPYGQLRRRAQMLAIGPSAVPVASVADLIEMKRAAGRKKDQADVEELEAIQRLQRRVRSKRG